ncbi:TIGR03943 family putative permease subunit [Paenibacillus sp. GCM10012303]|uniref:TIGR03943 family putative permease subunit n=1 Tax=Paenibacillus sp. GCM10012303 TaxID=3317340 RepID=UPI003615FBCF
MSNTRAWVHPTIKALLLFGFAAYIAYLVKTDRILYYISPRMVLYVKLSALGLYAVGAHQLYTALSAYWKRRASCSCGHDHNPGSPWKSAVVYGMFAFPLLLGFLMPDTTMGSSLAAKKGMNLNSAASIKTASPPSGAQPGPTSTIASPVVEPSKTESVPPPKPAPAEEAALSDNRTQAGSKPSLTDAELEKLFPFDMFTEAFAKHARKLYPSGLITVPEELYIETLTTLDLYADQFTDKKVKLSGFVYRDETMNERQFVIARFSIQCCSADAAPFGVLVESDKANLYAADQWVELTGTIGKTTFGGSELMVIQAAQLSKIEAPKEQYVYPNYDFGA